MANPTKNDDIVVDWAQTDKQSEAYGLLMDEETTELIFGGGAGGAKSFLGCAWIILCCLAFPETQWLIGRKKLKALKRTTLRTFFEICRMWNIKNHIDYKYNSQDNIITFTNGSVIFLYDMALYPADPNFDELGSLELTGAFIDEVNQIIAKAWEVVKSRIRYKLESFCGLCCHPISAKNFVRPDKNSKGEDVNVYLCPGCKNETVGLLPRILGTCNPSKNWVKTDFYDLDKAGKLEPGKRFLQSLVTDNPFISKSYISNLMKMKNKALKERLLNGNWEYDDDPAVLFEVAVINDLVTNTGLDDGIRYITGDVARKGRDKMVIMYWEGWILKEIHVLPYEIKKNTQESAKWIRNFAGRKKVRRSNIVLDEDGVGGGVVDSVEGCIGFVNNSRPLETREDKIKKDKGDVRSNWFYVSSG